MTIKVERTLWLCAAGIALSAGLYFRFAGFYMWPLAEDEYFIYRSMTFILESGLPQFPCGGYYTRGLLYQYLTVPLLYFGAPPEAAIRFVSILCNILTLPAAYLLARKIGGFRVAAAILIVLALSTWEIEMSRFGRMYAPFQLIFTWYVYHAYQLIATQDIKRWRWLFALSFVGPFVWEGAIVLSVFNFLPMLIDRKYGSIKHFIGSVVVLIATIAFLKFDFVLLDWYSLQPVSTQAATLPDSESIYRRLFAPVKTVFESPVSVAIFGFLISLLAAFAYRAVVRVSFSALELLVLASLCITLIANQLLLTAFVFMGVVLVGWIRPETLRKREVQHVAMTMILVCLGFVFIALLSDYAPTLSSRFRALADYPDVVHRIVYPWLSSNPLMAIVLAVCVLTSTYYCWTTNCDSRSRGLRLLIIFLLVSIAVIGVVPLQYHETRYTFFLYPLAMCIAGYAIKVIGDKLEKRQWSLFALVPASFVALFLISSDFAIKHLLEIDSYDANFRVGYSDARARHYYYRWDFRDAASYVNDNASDSDTVIVTSVVAANYLDRTDHVYLDRTDGRFPGRVCQNEQNEQIERWTGLPHLGTVSDLTSTIRSGNARTSWIIVDENIWVWQATWWASFLQANPEAKEVYRTRDNRIAVYVYPDLPRKM